IYTERFMRTPQENTQGYDECPIGRADKLSGKLLLCHGFADDNVHFRNAAEYSEALVQANKQFEMQYYVNRNHSINGGNTRIHLFTRINNFLLSNLK
ncbi:MAG: prolyl oligopeptidase family serine peptidase, partial [Bacteroidaceae bacterium]|nr:prolyl oligopeptidase family serine peptidase [Bacteroidaceae bacterium]